MMETDVQPLHHPLQSSVGVRMKTPKGAGFTTIDNIEDLPTVTDADPDCLLIWDVEASKFYYQRQDQCNSWFIRPLHIKFHSDVMFTDSSSITLSFNYPFVIMSDNLVDTDCYESNSGSGYCLLVTGISEKPTLLSFAYYNGRSLIQWRYVLSNKHSKVCCDDGDNTNHQHNSTNNYYYSRAYVEAQYQRSMWTTLACNKFMVTPQAIIFNYNYNYNHNSYNGSGNCYNNPNNCCECNSYSGASGNGYSNLHCYFSNCSNCSNCNNKYSSSAEYKVDLAVNFNNDTNQQRSLVLLLNGKQLLSLPSNSTVTAANLSSVLCGCYPLVGWQQTSRLFSAAGGDTLAVKFYLSGVEVDYANSGVDTVKIIITQVS